jgi:hypothetical protein
MSRQGLPKAMSLRLEDLITMTAAHGDERPLPDRLLSPWANLSEVLKMVEV